MRAAMMLRGGLLVVSLVAVAQAAPVKKAAVDPAVAKLEAQLAQFAPVELRVDVGAKVLPDHERQALTEIVRAAELMNPLFLRQVATANQRWLLQLAADSSPLGIARLKLFLLHKGPWDRLDHFKGFVPGVGDKPAPGSFYPADASRADIDAWAKTLTGAQADLAKGFFTTIRRDATGKLTTVPYSVEYQAELAVVAQHLQKAAALTTQPTLKAFLAKRATALLSNDYYPSDVAWMELDASIEPTIGPYEVYEDEWFNWKAAFEAFIGLRDDAETQKLARFGAQLQDIEDHLPITPALRNPKLGALAPIRVINQIYASGDAARGVTTAAFNLPNDERVAKEKGTKRVMLKNVQEAKFDKVLVPIAKIALSTADQANVKFDAFFTHILMHELMHGLGPHHVVGLGGGKATTVRQALENASSAIEEAKADVSGLFAMQYLIDKGVLDKSFEKTMYVTFLASAFRSIRFGINEAHGKGIALQLNTLLDAGAVFEKDGRFAVEPTKVKAAVTALTKQLMELQAAGNKQAAVDLLARQGVLRPNVKAMLDKLAAVPVDINPRFVTAEELLGAAAK